METRTYTLLISHVGKDAAIALKLVSQLNGFCFKLGDEEVKVKTLYMEDKEEGCFGDFIKWSEAAVRRSHGVLAIVTRNTLERKQVEDGTEANRKVVYDEVSLEKECLKDVLLLQAENSGTLEEGYRILFQNLSAVYFDGTADGLSEEVLASLKMQIKAHAQMRFAGVPLLEYAGKTNVELKHAALGDTSPFLGREDKIAEIDDFFNHGKKVVCLCGVGGMGKTTLAKMYAKAHPETPTAIFYCSVGEDNLKNAVVGLQPEHDLPDFAQMSFEEKFTLRISQLQKLANRTLIVVDNFNADFNTQENQDVLDLLGTLSQCRFLISSRNEKISREDVGKVDVGSLNEAQLAELFYRDSHCQRNEQNDVAISRLIEITNGHTMTVELAARAVGMDENAVTPQEIVEKLLSENSAETRLEDNARSDGYKNYDTILNHLRKLFALANLQPAHKHLLGSLSFVGRQGLSAQELKDVVK
ncbi:MAG: NACHT domain-containing protein, partial [Candidatus Fimimonas sp.]